MDDRGFRLRQIGVEGFKGFTERKTIPLNGKHAFILGPNSCGKSSIVEAIRWGIFGSTRRPGEIVANQSYTGSCRVELLLEREDGEWTLKRTLIRGVSGGSDAVIVDAAGQSHPLREILPQLESAPAGEGMHIIYAAQSAPLRRMPEDISAFERVILSYLGLTDARIAISRLKDFIEERQELAETRLSGEVSTKRASIESELNDLNEQRRRIIENPPWGAGSVPTKEDTTSRLKQFMDELSVIAAPESPPVVDLELGSLIRAVDGLVNRAGNATTNQVTTALSETTGKLEVGRSLLRELHQISSQIGAIEGEINGTKQSLGKTLSGETLETLGQQVEEIERQVQGLALLHDLRKKARAWLENQPQKHCPVCEEKPSGRDLLGDLTKRIELASSEEAEIVAKRDAAGERYTQASGLAEHLQELTENYASLQEDQSQLVENIVSFCSLETGIQDVSAVLQQRINELDNGKTMLERQLREANELQQEWRRRLDRLQDEVRFYRIQKELVQAQRQLRQAEGVEEELEKLTLFGDSVRAITDALEDALSDTLRSALPEINQRLTEAFNALTEHPAYNLILINEASLPKLELRVDSDDAPTPGGFSAQVLNGQALSALELVPYFAFSELADMPLEVYLLLLDDPTQSFDAHHIDILIAKLAGLGKRVQLIVASHEVDQFHHSLPQHFSPDDYVVTHVTAFSRQNGPTVEIDDGG